MPLCRLPTLPDDACAWRWAFLSPASGAGRKDALGTALLSAPELCAAAWPEPWLAPVVVRVGSREEAGSKVPVSWQRVVGVTHCVPPLLC